MKKELYSGCLFRIIHPPPKGRGLLIKAVKSPYSYGNMFFFDKVIASTNVKLTNLPNIPNELISYYNDHKDIEDVVFEFSGGNIKCNFPEKTYTKQEVEKLLHKCWVDARNYKSVKIHDLNRNTDNKIDIDYCYTEYEWIKENL